VTLTEIEVHKLVKPGAQVRRADLALPASGLVDEDVAAIARSQAVDEPPRQPRKARVAR
jgi:hypothetical protein